MAEDDPHEGAGLVVARVFPSRPRRVGTRMEPRGVGDRGRAEVGERSGTYALEEVRREEGMWRDGDHAAG